VEFCPSREHPLVLEIADISQKWNFVIPLFCVCRSKSHQIFLKKISRKDQYVIYLFANMRVKIRLIQFKTKITNLTALFIVKFVIFVFTCIS
jgi:hypothetical protein